MANEHNPAPIRPDLPYLDPLTLTEYRPQDEVAPFSEPMSTGNPNPCALTVNIDVDTNRDSEISGEPQYHEEEFTDENGAIVLVNSDDDDDDDGIDWQNTVIEEDDQHELTQLKVSKLGVDPIPDDVTVELTIEAPSPDDAGTLGAPGANDRIRIYYEDPGQAFPDRYVPILGRDVATKYTFPNPPVSGEPDLSGIGDDVTLHVEGCEYAADVMIVLTVKQGSYLCGSDRVRLMPAPFVMLSNLRNVEKLLVAADGGELTSRLDARLPNRIEKYTVVDQWAQDQWEFGFSSWPNLHDVEDGYPVMPDGIELPRYREKGVLKDYGREHLRGPVRDPDNLHGGWAVVGEDGEDQGEGQYGGNIEVSPPLTGTPFALGRIVVGESLTDTKILNFLKRQRIQAKRVGSGWELVTLPVKWLRGEHVDEIMNFVPGTSGSKSFKVVLPDPAGAKDLLGTSPADLGDVKNYATFFYGSPDDDEEAGTVESASVVSLTDSSKDFTHTPYKYVRIYHHEPEDPEEESSAGQVALINQDLSSGDRLLIDWRWTIPNSEKVREFVQEGKYPDNDEFWDPVPPAGSRYVLVKDSKRWLYKPKTGDPQYIPAVITAREVRDDSELWAKNVGNGGWGSNDIEGRINAAKDKMKEAGELGLEEGDFIKLPVFFMAKKGTGNEIADKTGAAMVPNLVNLVVVDDKDGYVRLIVAGPFGPRWPYPDPTDPKRDIYEYHARVELKLHDPSDGRTCDPADFVDDWDVYHCTRGETHCGTNVRRAPVTLEKEWWKKWKD